MAKLTVEDLKDIRERVRKQNLLRTSDCRIKVTVHLGAGGIETGAEQVLHEFMTQLSQRDVHDVVIATAGCIKKCGQEPLVTVEEKGKDPVAYGPLTLDAARKIFTGHILGGEIQHAFVMKSKRKTGIKGTDA